MNKTTYLTTKINKKSRGYVSFALNGATCKANDLQFVVEIVLICRLIVE
jgi:hypothetical protein